MIWCLGDSVAYQLCWGLKAIGYDATWDIVNYGQGTELTHQGIPKLIDLLLTEERPDLVVVQYGSGDILTGALTESPGYTPEEIYARMRTMEIILQYFGVGMVWTTTPVRFRGPVGTPWIDEYFENHYQLNRLIRGISIRTPGERFSDFAHPKWTWVEHVIAPKLARLMTRTLRSRGFSKQAAGYR